MVTSILKTDGLTPPYWLRGKSPTLTRLLLLLVLMLSLPLTAGATKYYLQGDYMGWGTLNSAYQITSSGQTFTFKGSDLYSAGKASTRPDGQIAFQVYADANEDNVFSWAAINGDYFVRAANTNRNLTVGSSITLSSYNNDENRGSSALLTGIKNDANVSYVFTVTYTDLNNPTITVTETTSGGDTPTPTPTSINKPGLYIFGSNYDNISGTPTSDTKLHYKLLKSGDNTYYIGVNASDFLANSSNFSVGVYNGDNTNITQTTNGTTFRLAYVDANGNMTIYGPQNGGLKGTSEIDDATARAVKSLDNNSSWTVSNNGGMYKLYIDVDENGQPKDWYFHSASDSLIAFRVSSASNWTTDAYLYSTLKNDGSSNHNFFGMVNFTANEEYKWLFMDKWFGERTTPKYGSYEADIAMDGSTSAPNLKFAKHTIGDTRIPAGVYTTEFNPGRDYIFSGDNLPTRIFIYGPAVTGDKSVNFTDWEYSKANELNWDDEEQCYKGVINFTQDKTFRFLRNTNIEGQPTSNALSFPEDENVVTSTDKDVEGDRWDYNHVSYQSTASNTPTNINFVQSDGSYIVRFFIDRKSGDSFRWDNNSLFHYTLESNSQMTITLDPEKKDVEYNTPQSVVATITRPFTSTLENNYYAFTVDGSEPQLSNLDGTPTAANNNTYIINYSTVNNANKIITNSSIVLERTSYDKIKLSTNNNIDDGKELSGWTLNDDHSITVTVKAVALRNIGTYDNPTYAAQGSATSELTFLRKLLTVKSTVGDGGANVAFGQTYEPDIRVEDETQEDKQERYYVFTFGDGDANTKNTKPALKGDGKFTAVDGSYIGQYTYYKNVPFHEMGTLWRTVDGRVKFTYQDISGSTSTNKTVDLTDNTKISRTSDNSVLKIFALGVRKTTEDTYVTEGDTMQISVKFTDIPIPNLKVKKISYGPGSFTGTQDDGAKYVGINGVWILPYVAQGDYDMGDYDPNNPDETTQKEESGQKKVRRPRRNSVTGGESFSNATKEGNLDVVFMYRVKIVDGDESSDATWSEPVPMYEHDYEHTSNGVGTVSKGIHLTSLPLGPKGDNKVQFWTLGDESLKVTLPYDITYSTSEAGYTTVLDGDCNSFGLKPDAGFLRSSSTGLISVYVRAKDGSSFIGNPRVTAYERINNSDISGIVFGTNNRLASPLTNANGKTADAEVEVGGKKWYRYTFDVGDTWHDVRMLQSIGIQVIDDSYNPSNGYVPYINDIQSDIFLEYDPSTHVCTDVTQQYTSAHFYTTNKTITLDEGYSDIEYNYARYGCPSKVDAFNPSSSSEEDNFIIVEVPSVLKSNYTAGSPKVTVRASDEPSYDGDDVKNKMISYSYGNNVPKADDVNNEFYKVPISGATEGQNITFGIYASKNNCIKSVTAKYYNGGYYSLSDMTAGLRMVFTPDEAGSNDEDDEEADGAVEDQRPDEYFNYNRVPDNGDMSYKIRFDVGDDGYPVSRKQESENYWKPAEESNTMLSIHETIYKVSSKAEEITDDYDYVNVSGGAITATAGTEDLPLEDGTYTVQAIVKAAEDATSTAQLSLNDATSGDGFASRTIKSSDNGTVNKYGRVDDNNSNFYIPTGKAESVKGWYKLEAKAKPVDGKITITLSAGDDNAFYLSDLVLLKDANNDAATDGKTVWTTAGLEQSKAVGSGKDLAFNGGSNYKDLSDRGKANSFSFFDRGENHNGIVFVSGNTSPGGMLYNPYGATDEYKHDTRSEVNVAFTDDNGSTFKMKKLVLDDTRDANHVNLNGFGFSLKENQKILAENISYNRSFTTGYQTICLPFALNADALSKIGTAYSFQDVSLNASKTKVTVNFTPVTSTVAGKSYIFKGNGASTSMDDLSSTDGFELTGTAESNTNVDGISGTFEQDLVPFNSGKRGVRPNYWVFQSGTFMPARYDDENLPRTTMTPFRAFFHFTKETMDNTLEPAKLNNVMYFAISDGTTTSIDNLPSDVFGDNDIAKGPIYNLNGQVVSKDGNANLLPKGVYIQNNRKFVVR